MHTISDLEKKMWYRVFKVIYIILCILGLGIVVLIGSTGGGFEAIFWSLVIVGSILVGIRMGFLYIARGK